MVFWTQQGKSYPWFLISALILLSVSIFITQSLFVVYYSTIIAEHKAKISISISPFHDHELTQSTACTKYSIQQVQHTHRIFCHPIILIIMSWPYNVASALRVPPRKINCHQPVLDEFSKAQSFHHIPLGASWRTDQESSLTKCTSHGPPPFSRLPGIQMHGKLAQLWPTTLLDYGFQ